MKTDTLNRFTPLIFSNGKTLLNRIVIPPMASQTSNIDGFVTEKTISHYTRLAEARPGLLIVEYSFVHWSGRSEEYQLGIHSDEHITGLKTLADTIKKTGALAGIQLTHAGAKTERCFTNGILMAPSNIAVPVKDRQLEVPNSMTLEDILLWKKSFVDAVDRAVLAGFDLVELHSAHGYGLNQWLSKITNHRIDIYGDSLQGRMKLLLEIIIDIRKQHPKLLLSVRIPGRDFIHGGIQIEDSILVAQALEKIGVDIINVSSGIGGWKRPNERNGEGYLLNEAEQIQAAVKTPVIGVGGIKSGQFIDESLQKNRLSLAAVGRAILKDPKKWQENT